MKRASGFTLIELVIVVVILGVITAVAVPKYLDLRDEAEASVIAGIGASFESAVNLAHYKYLVGGHTGAVDNLDIDGTGTRLLDMNSAGWPAQNYWYPETNPVLNNTNDCRGVWNTILDSGAPTVATDDSADFRVTYSAGTCTFYLVAESSYSLFYNSNTGEVTVDDIL